MYSINHSGYDMRRMIHAVEVKNLENDETLYFDLERPGENGFTLVSVTGITPITATINSTDLASGDGAVFSSSRVSTRNIVLTLLLTPDGSKSIEEQRIESYKYFPVKKRVRLTFFMGTKTAYINGYVESNETSIFTASEACKISIICTNPYFVNTDSKCELEFSSVDKGFEFPFYNNSVQDGTDKLIFGEVKNKILGTVHYYGDVDAGMIFTVHIGSKKVEGLTITATTYGSVIAFDDAIVKANVDGGFQKGDDICINTNKGQKSIYLFRGDYAYNLLNCVGKGVSFPQLRYGDNIFSVDAKVGAYGLTATVEADILYLGL